MSFSAVHCRRTADVAKEATVTCIAQLKRGCIVGSRRHYPRKAYQSKGNRPQFKGGERSLERRKAVVHVSSGRLSEINFREECRGSIPMRWDLA